VTLFEFFPVRVLSALPGSQIEDIRWIGQAGRRARGVSGQQVHTACSPTGGRCILNSAFSSKW